MKTLVKFVVHGLAIVGGLQLLKEYQNRQPVESTDNNGVHKITTI